MFFYICSSTFNQIEQKLSWLIEIASTSNKLHQPVTTGTWLAIWRPGSWRLVTGSWLARLALLGGSWWLVTGSWLARLGGWPVWHDGVQRNTSWSKSTFRNAKSLDLHKNVESAKDFNDKNRFVIKYIHFDLKSIICFYTNHWICLKPYLFIKKLCFPLHFMFSFVVYCFFYYKI